MRNAVHVRVCFGFALSWSEWELAIMSLLLMMAHVRFCKLWLSKQESWPLVLHVASYETQPCREILEQKLNEVLRLMNEWVERRNVGEKEDNADIW
jgi:hypothetical protein